jgi:serine/threonine protein phosphatase PrpC
MTSHTLTIAAAGATDPGLQREVNEDRFHVDEARGLFIVIDGIGGQAAGGRAADIALATTRERLERETGPITERVREAIAVANNEIYRLASSRPEWDGMACVLTIAVVKDGRVTVGHVGDTRLYKLRDGRIEKITRDHSPVGEREDARELSELEAMRHPRRNEVYRDVGSEWHAPGDPEFVDVLEIPFEAADALLLCSDGLSDLLDSSSILRIVSARADAPPAVVRALIDAANAAGGKDNVTAVFVQGENFRASKHVSHQRQGESVAAVSRSRSSTVRRRLGMSAAVLSMLFISSVIAYRAALFLPQAGEVNPDVAASEPENSVRPGESIAAAVGRAQPGSVVVVEPGEYRERVRLTNGIRLVSRVPRAAILRLPPGAADGEPEPAVALMGSRGGELVGFKVVGDAMTPLGVGVLVDGSSGSLVDIEVSGASMAAISFGRETAAALVGSDVHDNPGAALAAQAGARPRITHNVFERNGMSPRTPATFAIEPGSHPVFQQNVFHGVRPDAFASFDEPAQIELSRENWFLSHGSGAPSRPAPVSQALRDRARR